jgi:hypothetical protein
MKKIIYSALSVLLVLSFCFFTGCGTQEEETAKEAAVVE